MNKSLINKVFLVLMLAVMALGLTGCFTEEKTPDYIPPYEEPGNTEPVDEEPADEVTTDKTVKYDKELTKDVWETINLDVTGYTQIKITLQGKPNANPEYGIPVNINNFKVDGNEVAYTGVTGTSYVMDHEFKIGELNAVGSLINTHKDAAGVTSLRLHTYHKTHGTEHFITIDVANINTFEFQYKVTTNSFAYLGAVVIDFIV